MTLTPDLKNMVSPEMAEHLDVAAKQIWYWRRHLDCFIVDYLKLPLYDLQRLIIRQIGNCEDVNLALLRGFGKTYMLALATAGLCLLYPGSPVIVVSNTAAQANLLLQKLQNEIIPASPALAAEIDYSPKHGIKINSNGRSYIYFKGGSRIQACVLGRDGSSSLGLRGKIVVVDESKLVASSIINTVMRPIVSFKRRPFHVLKDKGFQDYKSKVIGISSAYLKSCDFYERFLLTTKSMSRGNLGSFACALDFHAAVRMGIEDLEFYERARESMSPVEFATEYGSVFVGAADNAVFPYSLTEPCRVLDKVEISQPKGTDCEYVISADVAGNGNVDTADNSCIMVIKIVKTARGVWQKHLVWMAAYRGLSQRQLAEEIRKVYLRFPNTVRIVYDANAIGRGLESLFDEPYQYEDDKGQKREMPPLLPFNSLENYRSIKILYPFIATNALNNEMVNCLTRAFEDRALRLPIISTSVNNAAQLPRLSDEDDTDEENDAKAKRTMLMTEEAYVFREADELQAELGNIVRRLSAQGNAIYGTAISTQRKDRFSALEMGMWFIDTQETVARKSAYDDSLYDEIPIYYGTF